MLRSFSLPAQAITQLYREEMSWFNDQVGFFQPHLFKEDDIIMDAIPLPAF